MKALIHAEFTSSNLSEVIDLSYAHDVTEDVVEVVVTVLKDLQGDGYEVGCVYVWHCDVGEVDDEPCLSQLEEAEVDLIGRLLWLSCMRLVSRMYMLKNYLR